MTRKYILYESQGFSKEYNIFNDRSIYKIEFLNGKRDGIGREYYNDVLIFEGEYLNGKKWNGKGYTRNGNVLYELKDGSGLVKEYNIKDNIIFEGHYKNGEKMEEE